MTGTCFKQWVSCGLALGLGGVLASQGLAQSVSSLDGSKPAAEIVGDTGAPYENLFRPARVGGNALDPKIGPGRLNVPLPVIGSPTYSVPLVNRGFRPEDAEVKIGRLYLDIEEASASVLVSDNINQTPNNRKAGSISIARMLVTLMYQLNDGLQLSISGSFVWLPFRGEAGVNGFGIQDPVTANFGFAPLAHAQLSYDLTVAGWDVRLIDDFEVTTPDYAAILTLDQQFEGSSFEEADTAGKYRYSETAGQGRTGVTGARDRGFRSVDLIYHNAAGVSAQRLLPIDVAANLSYFHHNYWYSGNLSGLRTLEEARGSLISVRENMRFRPFVRTENTTDDRRDGWDHQMFVGFLGPISDYTDIYAEFGRFWQDNSTASYSLWRVRLDNTPGPLTSQSIEYGRTITRPERTLLEYVTYRLYRVLGPYMLGELFASRQSNRSLTVGLSGYRQYDVGARVSYDLGDRTDLRMTGLWQRIENDNAAAEEIENFVARVEFIRSHSRSMDSTILYEFRDQNSTVPANSFYENLLIYTLRKQF